MLTKDGTKLLDFGLAKAKPLHGAVAEAESGPTQTALTGEGSIIGTLQYMAPAQLEGKEADARSDIFAFGEVFYEMATGRKAFDGKSQASLIAAILDSDPPPLRALQPRLPPMLDHLVGRCVAKDPDERWQSVSDVKTELKWIGEESSQTATAGPAAGPQRCRERTAWTVASVSLGIAAISLAFSVWSSMRTRSAAIPRGGAIRFSVGEGLPIRLADPQRALAWSRDGRQLLYTAAREGTRRLFLRCMSHGEPVPIPRTEGATAPFFSPDGQWAAFFAGGRLKKVSLSGGAPVTLADTPVPRGATWGPDDTVYFSPATTPDSCVCRRAGARRRR